MGSNGFSALTWLSHDPGHVDSGSFLTSFVCLPLTTGRLPCAPYPVFLSVPLLLLFCPLPRSLFLPPNMHFITFFPFHFFFHIRKFILFLLRVTLQSLECLSVGAITQVAVPQLKLSRECVLPNSATRGCVRNICGIFPAEPPLSGWLCCRKEKGARGPGLAIHKIKRGLAQKACEHRATG